VLCFLQSVVIASQASDNHDLRKEYDDLKEAILELETRQASLLQRQVSDFSKLEAMCQ
jgi:hypothetical protein